MEDEKHSKILAGLCYIPIMMIHIFAIIYILLTKSGGRYTKFHALQALAIFVIKIVIALGFVAIMIVLLSVGIGVQTQDIPLPVLASMAVSAVIVLFALGITIAEIVIGVMVATGRNVRLPILAKFVDKFV